MGGLRPHAILLGKKGALPPSNTPKGIFAKMNAPSRQIKRDLQPVEGRGDMRRCLCGHRFIIQIDMHVGENSPLRGRARDPIECLIEVRMGWMRIAAQLWKAPNIGRS